MTYRIRQIGAVVATAVLTASCAKDDLNWLIGTPITVTATTEQPTTRTGADIQTANFESGATINAYYNIHGGTVIGKTPTILTASAANASTGKNTLTPDVQPYYPESGTVDIMALYPTTVTNSTTSFTVQADQTGETNYKSSDLMWAGISGQARTTGDVNLQFAHLMAKMTVTVTGKEDVLVKSVSLMNVVRTVPVTLAASGYTVGTVGTVSDAAQKTILLASTTSTTANNTLSGTVLFPPQTIGGQLIKVTTNYGDAYFSTVNKAFARGEAYTASLVVKREDIGFTSSITDWADNGGSIAIPPGSSAGLKIAEIPTQTYDGTAKTPALTITYTPNSEMGLGSDPYTLVKDKDYTAEYYNNTLQGTAMVIITGKKSPDRTGSQEPLANIIAGIKSMTSFEIQAAPGSIAYPSTTKSVEYQYNTTVTHELNKNGGDGKFTYTSSNTDVADVTISGVVTIRNVGTTRITASMDGSGNYTACTAYYDLTVTPRSIKNNYKSDGTGVITTTMAANSYPYQNAAYTPAVVVKDNGRTLQEGKHYTLSYANNTQVGTAAITITGTGNYSDKAADAITVNFGITAITPTITMETTAVTLAKGQKFTRRAKTDQGTITYSASPSGYVTISSDGVVEAINSTTNTYPQDITITASVTADGTNGNWGAASKSYTLTVVQSEWAYTYADGRIHEWECPVDGVYQLEAMGAQGATTNSFNGGRGADVAGQVFIKKGQKLYIYLGQAGTVQPGEAGGWNGGGVYSGSTTSTGNNYRFTGGGGATDFSLIKVTEENWATDDHLYSRIIVAGGGGGALYCSRSGIACGGGGSGGGEDDSNHANDYNGEEGYGGSNPGGGGTLSGGGVHNTTEGDITVSGTTYAGGAGGNDGMFGKGGDYNSIYSAGCGGGGWYGGASGSMGIRHGAGGGGSSFIYNTANISKTTDTTKPSYNYRSKLRTPSLGNYFDPATLEITQSILVTGGSPDVNGQARITYMSAE